MKATQKILFVDLSTGKIEKKVITEALRRKFLGGRGIDDYILYTRIKPGIDPLGPENVLSVSAGVVVGTGMPSASRTHVSAKSPLTDLLGSSNMGGDFASEMRYAGYDNIVVSGKADHPVYLLVRDDNVEVKDGAAVWGQDTVETERIIRTENGDQEIKIMTIGIAGENLVRYACVISPPKNAGGRTGMGAEMT